MLVVGRTHERRQNLTRQLPDELAHPNVEEFSGIFISQLASDLCGNDRLLGNCQVKF
jgi:hypothetical protein